MKFTLNSEDSRTHLPLKLENIWTVYFHMPFKTIRNNSNSVSDLCLWAKINLTIIIFL